MSMYKRVIQLELNELSKEVIDRLVAKGELKTFAEINNNWAYHKTISESDYEKLEPWIQWVTVHTGKTFDEHQIFRLSDVHKLAYPQIWEVLSSQGIESGIIGSMNVTRRNTKGGIFFPDPWAIQNDTYPESLRPLWDLISSKVQGHATGKIRIKDLLKGFKASLELGIPIAIYFKMAGQLLLQKINPKTKWKLAGVFDEFLAEIFLKIICKTNFGFYTLFLNSIAHYQHHYWRAFDIKPFKPEIKYDDIREQDDPVLYGYKVYDKILERILAITKSQPDTLVIILSALSQVPYTQQDDEGGMNYYRLNDHKAFAALIGLGGSEIQIFPLMSRDWQVKYESEEAKLNAKEKLLSLSINGDKLFNVKENTEGFLFVETAYTKGVQTGDQIKSSDGLVVVNFKDVFTNIAIKSGHHCGIGHFWISDRTLISPNAQNEFPLTSVYHTSLQAILNQKQSSVGQ
jgi:hypothetical protein